MKKNNDKNLAIALKYLQNEMDAPQVVAKGRGEVAKKIIEMAQKNRIPIEDNQQLAEILSTVEINDKIPAESFAAIASILSKIYEIDAR